MKHINGKSAREKITVREEKNAFMLLRGIVKKYRSPAGTFEALRGIDLEVAQGESLAIVGKSGSGKSTLLNILSGIDTPSSGEVSINGTDVRALGGTELALWRGTNIGVVFQFFQLLPTLTVIENVMLPMDFAKSYSQAESCERAMQLLERVGIPEQADKLPATLSGGQQQRAAIARALANDPPIIVADEPTGNLDSATADVIFGLFGELIDEGKSIVMVTHEREITSLMQRTIMLTDGLISNNENAQAGALEVRHAI